MPPSEQELAAKIAALEARLVIRDRGTVLTEEALTLEPGEVREHRARGFSSAQGELTATLEDVALDGGRDALARDDLADRALLGQHDGGVARDTPPERVGQRAHARQRRGQAPSPCGGSTFLPPAPDR